MGGRSRYLHCGQAAAYWATRSASPLWHVTESTMQPLEPVFGKYGIQGQGRYILLMTLVRTV